MKYPPFHRKCEKGVLLCKEYNNYDVKNYISSAAPAFFARTAEYSAAKLS